MTHRDGQVWVKDYHGALVVIRVCLSADEGKYVTFTEGGSTWVWTMRERVPQPYDGWYGDFWDGWEEMT